MVLVPNIGTIKTEVVNTLRVYLEPKQDIGSTTCDLYDSGYIKYAQSFIPFSSTINSISVYLDKTGTPTSPLTISVQRNVNSEPSGTTLGTTTYATTDAVDDWSTKTLSIGNLISKNIYWLVCESSGQDASNYYKVIGNSVDTGYSFGGASSFSASWSTLNSDLKFKVFTPRWIYKVYPADTLTLDKFPRISVDIISRPIINEKYCDVRIIEVGYTAGIFIYGRYKDELDLMMPRIEEAMFANRESFSNIKIVIPSGLGDLAIVRNKIFVRSANYNFIGNQSIQ